MNLKIVRKLDELGRIVLPQDFRKDLSWSAETRIAITKQGSQLILQADKDSCFICGSEQNLTKIKDKHICSECILEIKRI